jgi:hypothetical protein
VHQLFIDFKKTYDSVREEVLYNVLIEFRVFVKLVRLIKLCVSETYSEVRIGKRLLDTFAIQNGLKQGDALLPLLFNFALEPLRRIFGPRRDEVIGVWRKLHDDEFHNFCSSPNIIRIIKSSRIRWAGYEARMREKRNTYRVLVGKPDGRIPVARPGRRWEDNIEVYLREIGWGCMDRIDLAEDGD